jgi:hypothetical protein
VGQLLSGANGSWTGAPLSYAYQWQSAEPVYDNGSIVTDDGEIVVDEWASIGGATSINLTVAAAQLGLMLRLSVIATNGDGASAPAYSTQAGPVAAISTSGTGLSAAFPAGLSAYDRRLILLIGN